ncbi:MAG: IPExxxVDY family protein [Marinirhabdus sp.]|nr:IPExxxVDY family protein [Marinirhabdus sp.]
MAHYKLILEDDVKEEFALIAIHCSEEAYKMAFLLNQLVHLRLQRRRTDVDYSNDGLEITFPLFQFEDQTHYTTYDLVANKCKTMLAHTVASGNLFGDGTTEDMVTKYLIPELKKVDFLLKITSDYDAIPLRKLLMQINEINQVISAYTIETDQLKSKDNLIFD